MVMRCSPRPSRGQQPDFYVNITLASNDAARAPHGDSNEFMVINIFISFLDAARAPHGDSN